MPKCDPIKIESNQYDSDFILSAVNTSIEYETRYYETKLDNKDVVVLEKIESVVIPYFLGRYKVILIDREPSARYYYSKEDVKGINLKEITKTYGYLVEMV